MNFVVSMYINTLFVVVRTLFVVVCTSAVAFQIISAHQRSMKGQATELCIHWLEKVRWSVCVWDCLVVTRTNQCKHNHEQNSDLQMKTSVMLQAGSPKFIILNNGWLPRYRHTHTSSHHRSLLNCFQMECQ